MSTFIQIPSNLTKIKSNNKFIEIYTYLLIRNQIKDSSYKASISEKELSTILDVSERSVKKYISDLKTYIDDTTLCQGNGKYPYNVYHFSRLEKDYSIILPSIISDTDLTPTEKGILIRMKLLCNKGTNYISFKSKSELTKILGISKNNISKILKDLADKNQIQFIGNSLNLSTKYFPLSIVDDDSYDSITNFIYEIIYKYCLVNKVIPPLRDKKAFDYLIAMFPNKDDSIIKMLVKKCPSLPNEVSLDYFVKALENKKIIRTENIDFNIVL